MISETFPVSGVVTLDCSFASGSIVVENGDEDSVVVTVDTRSPGSWRVTQNGNHVTVVQDRDFRSSGGRASVRVLVPAQSSVSIRTASADVRLSARLDRVGVTTASGDIHMGDTGSVEVKTASGDVSIKSIGGDLSLKAASGDVRIGRCEGTVSVTTASGDMALGEVHGRLAVTTASGDVGLAAYMGDDVEIASMSGDIDVRLPTGIKVDLKANTLAGRVVLPERRSSERSASGRRVTVRLKSISGDIRLDRLDGDS